MKEKLAKFGLNIKNFNVELLAKMSFKEFETLYKKSFGKNLKEIFTIFTETKSK